MKKIIAVLLVVVTVVALVACASKSGSGQDGEKRKDDSDNLYGTWACVKLESIDGTLPEDILEATRKEFLEKGKLFYFEIGDNSYLYDPQNEGGYKKIEVVVDFEQGKIYAVNNESNELLFELVDGSIVIDEEESGIRFILGRE